MKIKRFWKLYNELRLLRKRSKTLENDLCQANRNYNSLLYNYNELRYRKTQEVPYSTMSIMIPNMYGVESCFNRPYVDAKPRAEYVQKRMSDKMKLKLIDDLFEQGFIRKVQDNEMGEVYEIKCIKER